RGPVLADLHDATFVRDEAERLDELRFAATESRISAELDLGRHAASAPELEGLVATHPLRERLSGQLMTALYRCGRQADALSVYRRLRERLVEELGIDPSAELRELEQRILVQDATLMVADVGAARAGPVVGSVALPIPKALLNPALPLVGREDHLRVVDAVLEGVGTAKPQIVMLAGEPGIGKTRLLSEVAARAGARSLTVLYGRCYEEPFGAVAPLVEAVTPLLRASVNDGRLDRPIRSRSLLGRLFPDLPLQGVPEGPALDPAEEQARLLMGLIDLFEVLVEGRPTVLIVDDLHWADRTSMQALLRLASRIDQIPLLIIGAYRDGELTDGPLAPALDRMRREAELTVLSLTGLGPAEAEDLLEGLVGQVDETAVADLHSRTGGNPLFLSEYAHSIPALSEGHELPAADLAVPDGIRAVVRQRLDRLTPATADMLAVASVCGVEVDFATLATVVALDEDGLIAAVEEASTANLITEVPGNGERLAFTHALVRDTLYESFSSLRRRRLHRRVADHLDLAVVDDPRSVVEMARHLLASDPAADLQRVIGHAINAAQLSFDQLAFDQACDFYEQVLELLDQGASRSRDRSLDVLFGLARAQRATGLHDAARATCLRAISVARDLGPPDRFAEAVIEYLWFHPATPFVIQSTSKTTDDTKQVLDLLDEAREQMQGGPALLRALVGAHRSLLTTDDLERKRSLADSSVEDAEAAHAPGVLALAIHARLSARFDPDLAPDELGRVATRIEELAVEAGDVDRRATAMSMQVQSALEAGSPDRLDQAMTRFRSVASNSHVTLHHAYAESLEAMRALMVGSLGDVEQHSAKAVELSGNDENFVVGWAMQVVNARRQHGQLAEVLAPMVAFGQRFASNPAWTAALALIHVETGDTAEAQTTLAVAMDGFRAQARDSFWLVTAVLAAEAAFRVENSAAGAELAEVLLPFSGRGLVVGPSVVFLGAIDRYQGLAELARGDRPAAGDALSRATVFNRGIGAEPLVAHCLFEGALATSPEVAGPLVAEARSIAVRLGMQPLLERIGAAQLLGTPGRT
ncbi:MAG: BTAD domain-containing putative transcriptional regulator, partial [Acidimicrobiales bacterium]